MIRGTDPSAQSSASKTPPGPKVQSTIGTIHIKKGNFTAFGPLK